MINGIDWTAHGPGYVDVRTTHDERAREVANWERDPWHPVIAKLVADMEVLDPDFDLVQVKAKFNELTVYFSTDTFHRPRMQALVDQATVDCMRLDNEEASG